MPTTYTGRLLTPNTYGVPSPLDMAVQLGRLPRFAGATRHWPWTVLHHVMACVHFAKFVIEQEALQQPAPRLLAVLLHEADECATGDIPTTFKTEDTKVLAERIQRRTCMVYARQPIGDMYGDFVKLVDMHLLAAEMLIVGPPGVTVHSGMDVLIETYDEDYMAAAGEAVRHARGRYAEPYDTGYMGSRGTADFLAALTTNGSRWPLAET